MNMRHDDALTRIPARIWKIGAVTGAGAFMAMLDSTVANLALESIRTDLDSTLPVVQWVITGYLVALTVSLPTAGWLGRRYGYGRVWTAAVAGFIAASILCGLAPEPLTLIGARFLQGLAAGLMVPAGQAVIGSTAGSNQLGRIMGTLGLVIALGPVVGPGAGGLLLEVASWRWLFWINVPIGIATLVAARNLVPGGATNASCPLDRRGLALVGLGLPLLLYGATRIASGSTYTSSVPVIAAGVVMTTGFVLTSLNTRHPLIDLRLMNHRLFSAGTVIVGLTGANMYGGLLILPLYLQLAMHLDVAETGVMLLAMGLGSAIVLPIAGTLTDLFGARGTTLVGGGVLFATTVAFIVFPDVLSTTTLTLLLVSRGVGMALAQMPAMTVAYASVTADQMGDATTLVNIVQRTGGAIGSVVMVILFAQVSTTSGIDEYVPVFTALALMAALTLVSAACMRQPTCRVSRGRA